MFAQTFGGEMGFVAFLSSIVALEWIGGGAFESGVLRNQKILPRRSTVLVRHIPGIPGVDHQRSAHEHARSKRKRTD